MPEIQSLANSDRAGSGSESSSANQRTKISATIFFLGYFADSIGMLFVQCWALSVCVCVCVYHRVLANRFTVTDGTVQFSGPGLYFP